MGYYREISASLGKVFVVFVRCHTAIFFLAYFSGKLDYVRYAAFGEAWDENTLNCIYLISNDLHK
jgi:hypothetical protein